MHELGTLVPFACQLFIDFTFEHACSMAADRREVFESEARTSSNDKRGTRRWGVERDVPQNPSIIV